jgi:DNA-binding PadR family transcriptional regulator
MRRPSHQTRLVLQALLDAPGDETYGYELSKAAGLPSGVLYPILRRLEQQDVIRSRWEQAGGSAGRRPRRYYRLTGVGERVARDATGPDAEALRSLVPGWTI